MSQTHWQFDVQLEQSLLERAYERTLAVFSGWELTPAGRSQYLSILLGNQKVVLDIARDVVPALAFAERYFNALLPDSLIKKLTNKTQTQDTLFELFCLGIFSARHKVEYEPKIESGRVPDLLIQLTGGPPLFVECKSHHVVESKYFHTFNTVSSRLCNAINEAPVVKAAWAEGLRTEIQVTGTPSEPEIESLRQSINSLQLQTLKAGFKVSSGILIRAVLRTQGNISGASMYLGLGTAGPEPSQIGLNNTHIVTYSWPGLDKQRRTRQRELLKDARLQLRKIPAGSFGMICIQTISDKSFLPDIHKLIDQPQFSRIPIILLNPSLRPCADSKIVFRAEATALMDKLFC